MFYCDVISALSLCDRKGMIREGYDQADVNKHGYKVAQEF